MARCSHAHSRLEMRRPAHAWLDCHSERNLYYCGSSDDLGRALRAMSQPRKLKGLAFDIADLQAVQKWAAQNDVCIDIRLDHGVEDEEYEEVIAFRTSAGSCFLLMWRGAKAVYAQPMPGRQLRFPSVSAALSHLYLRSDTPAAQ